MTGRHVDIDEVRGFYGRLMAAASGSNDPRLERVFSEVSREVFLSPGPWKICFGGRYFETPSADPVYLYQNALVALDASKGINNGEPHLHAGWIGAAAPIAGEVVCHIGAGVGYYTAMLSMLTQPSGFVHAFEIDERLAERARHNLASFDGVSVIQGDATVLPVPSCDLIYVNAGVAAPPLSWLEALRPGGRMIFPWRPAERVGLAIIVSRREGGLGVTRLAPAWFIPCVGASSTEGCSKAPDAAGAWSVRSVWRLVDREPDETAVAVYRDVWFSNEPVV